VTVTNTDGCTAAATTVINVSTKLNGGNDISICEPISTAQLNLIAGATWSLEPTNPAPATINNTTGAVSGLTQNGIYVVYLTSTSGCKDTVNIYRNQKLDAGDDVVICSPKSTASLLQTSTGQTWRYFANGSTLPAPSINSSGNVSGITQDGTYLFILEQQADNYCADTVAVIRKATPNAGTDLVGANGGICEPETMAKLPATTTGQTWLVATNSAGFGTVAIDATGNITKMNTNGVYIFVLKQGECTDSVKVERIAKPNAGVDLSFCADSTKFKLPNAPTNMTWSSLATNPSNAQVNATTGEITGLTAIGDYQFVLTNASGCSDTVKVSRKAVPTFDAITQQATCSIGEANADAKIILSNLDLTNKYDYSEGTSYTGGKTFASATNIIATTVTISSLANPTASKSYTIRVFNSNGCFTDKTVVLTPRICDCKSDVCVPYTMTKTK
jgi:hypothetical protein